MYMERKTLRSTMFSLVGVLVALQASSVRGLQIYTTGNGADSTATPEPGLLLAGGGRDVDSAMRWFRDRVNGGDLVVLRASGSDGYNDYLYHQLPGVRPDSVQTLVIDRRSDAYNGAVLRILERAEGIFIAGGDQADYDAYWRGTPVEDVINEKVAAGTPLGGTSAGLAILGSTAYVARSLSIYSSEALADPYHDYATLEHDFLDVPGLEDLVTDSHFSQRSREGRLAAFTARVLADTPADVARGIGVDEDAALTIDHRGEVTFHGPSNRSATLLRLIDDDLSLTPGQPLTAGPYLEYVLDDGGGFDLDGWRPSGSTGATRTWFAYENGARIDLGNLGDLNFDGVLDAGDLDLLSQTPDHPDGDLNLDGLRDEQDLAFLVRAVMGTELGDANLDGRVDLTDLSTLAFHFDEQDRSWATADFNADGRVDLLDLSILAGGFGFERSAGLPEPSAGLTLLGLMAVSVRRVPG
ncbi:Cyanophycinase [Mucisphaera calidilacus]|uniref:Cyanophycinase n=2 Tax=Mucisphaera calidilacus TaxID=2527982 RepID=A0A518BX08_9BACT|nr:Cyanophycinase [Mucisphaera calidilacus]